MPDQELKTLLKQLQQELSDTDSVSPEVLAQVRELEEDIHKLVVPSPTPEAYETVMDRARNLETRFAVNHPVAERFLSQIMDTLSKLGI